MKTSSDPANGRPPEEGVKGSGVGERCLLVGRPLQRWVCCERGCIGSCVGDMGGVERGVSGMHLGMQSVGTAEFKCGHTRSRSLRH